MRKRESDFKAACNAELSRMQQELEELSVRRQERALSVGFNRSIFRAHHCLLLIL